MSYCSHLFLSSVIRHPSSVPRSSREPALNQIEGQALCLMGPTASGKSKIALKLAAKFPIEIVSVDSAMVYRTMNIGTAKPSPEELKKIPHHLIDIRDPQESYSAEDFRKDALIAIEDIIARNKIPLLVGGTMLYFKALQNGLSKLPSANKETREKLKKEAAEIGWEKMHARLAKIDPIAAKRIHPNDPQRIQRALEVYEITGEPISKWHEKDKNKLSYKFVNIAIVPKERQMLREKITARFEKMLGDGLINEVKFLYERGDLSRDLPSMRAVGYRQILEYLAGKTNFNEMKQKAITATCQLAKRQLTWLRSWPDVYWFDSDDPLVIKKIEELILECKIKY